MSTHVNEPAFPSNKACDSWQCRKPSSGMSIRDYLAAQVFPAIWETSQKDKWAQGGPEWRAAIAEESYRMADEMLKAREGKGK